MTETELLPPSCYPASICETPAPPVCQEDEPCWDCTTMGNRICGPTAGPIVTTTTTTVASEKELPVTGADVADATVVGVSFLMVGAVIWAWMRRDKT